MGGVFTEMVVSFNMERFLLFFFSHRTKSGNENRLENSNGYGLAFNEMKGFFMSATPGEFLEMMIVNHKESNKFMLSPDAGRHCLTHSNDSFSLSSCSGTGSFVSMQLSFLSEEKESFKHKTRKLFHDLPSAKPTKQETHLLGNLENIIDGVMIDFEDVWKDVSLVDHPSVAPTLSPSDSPSSAPSGNPSEMPSLLPSSGPTTVPSLSVVPSMNPSESPTLSPYPLISVNLNFRLIMDLCAYYDKDITFGLEQSLTDYLRRNPIPLNGLEVFWVESITVLNNCTEAAGVPQHIIYTIVTARVIPGFPSTIPTLTPTTTPSLSKMPSLDPTSAPSGFPTGVPTADPSSEPSETPTNTPSVTSSPPTVSLQPSLAPTFCTDWYGFQDSYGDDCKWYEDRLAQATQCPFYGQYWANSDGVSADMACCYW